MFPSLKKLLAFIQPHPPIEALRSHDWRIVKQTVAQLRSTGDLQESSLRGVNLRYVDWHGLDLHHANLTGADLRGASLFRAKLHGAKLAGAKLQGADLQESDLTEADLREATLTAALLYRAILPDGNKWHPNINLDYFTDPLSSFYGQHPAYVLSKYIPREVKP